MEQQKITDAVYYEDFGAVGDGVTDDFAAIFKAHEYANEHKLPVYGTPGKTYYIFDTAMGEEWGQPAIIKTPVNWQGAEFIIDDRNLSAVSGGPNYGMALRNVFSVVPEKEHEMFKIEDPEKLDYILKQGINQKTTKIDLGIDWNGPVMIVPYSTAHRVFRRRGYSQYPGEAMHELIVLRPDGTVDPETPIMFDYKSLDYICVFRLDESSAITIENGVFTTLDTRVNHKLRTEDGTFYYKSGYIRRGLEVTRSYTTVKNIKHIVKGGFTLKERVEDDVEGSMYNGFYRASYANRVIFKDCVMPGRIAYGTTAHSSYNFGALCVNKIVLDNCFQPNFWVTIDYEKGEVIDGTEYAPGEIGNAKKASPDAIGGMNTVEYKGVKKSLCWGIGGTNYCKNMEYLNSTLSRLDAHAGLYNGKIINSNVNSMELTGVGTFILQDSAWYSYGPTTPLLYLRADYGYHWDGDIIIKNHKSYIYPEEMTRVAHFNYINWYFGYVAKFPNITFDGATYYDIRTEKPMPAGFDRVRLMNIREEWKKMHLDDVGIPSIFAALDADGDGYIDEPIFDRNHDGELDPPCDLDGDGRVGNTSLKLADYYEENPAPGQRPRHWFGIEHPTCTANLNLCCPPAYLKVVNNKNEKGETVCRYRIIDTSKEGISDGGWHRSADTPDSLGGYFGTTKFIYGEGEGDFFYGTKDKGAVSDSFLFEDEYFVTPPKK